jgi:flagellar hook-length control protein FliK
MNPIIATLPMPSSLPVAGAPAKDSRGLVSGLSASTKADANGAVGFSAILKILSGMVPGSTPVTDSTDQGPGQTETVKLPNKTTSRQGDGKSTISDAVAAAANLAIAAPPAPSTLAFPGDPQITPEIAATTAEKAGIPQTLPAIATSQSTQPSVATNQTALPPIAADQSAPPSSPMSQLASAPRPTSQSDIGVSHLLQPNFETPADPQSTRLESRSGIVPGPIQAVPAALDSVDKTANSVTGHEREQLSAERATTPTAAGANLVAAPAVEFVAHSAATNSAPSLRDQIHDQLSGHLEQVQQTGRVDAQFNLHPPELGRVQLHVTLEDGRLNVRMLVQDENAKRLIDQQVEPLRVRFAEMGVSVGQFDVRRDGSSANSEKQQSAEPSAHALQPNGVAASGASKSYAKVANSNGLVDVIA